MDHEKNLKRKTVRCFIRSPVHNDHCPHHNLVKWGLLSDHLLSHVACVERAVTKACRASWYAGMRFQMAVDSVIRRSVFQMIAQQNHVSIIDVHFQFFADLYFDTENNLFLEP